MHRGPLTAVLFAVATAPLGAQRDEVPTGGPVPETFQRSSDRALRFLLNAQNRNGSWGDEPGSPGDVGNTAWAAMSLLAMGYTPTRGEHAMRLRRAMDWLRLHTRGFDEQAPFFAGGTLLQRKLGKSVDLFLVTLCYSQMVGMCVDMLAPVASTASFTVLNTGTPIVSVPPLPGDVPPITFVP